MPRRQSCPTGAQNPRKKMLKFSITPDAMLSKCRNKALESLMPPYLRSMLKDFYLHALNATGKSFFLLHEKQNQATK
jgi:hypothetical protein